MSENNVLISAYGVVMPKIIYGTAWKQEWTAALVEQAIGLGFRGIDTACQPKHYHEAGVGEGIMASLDQCAGRSGLYLQTKFTALDGQDPLRVPYNTKASLAEQVAQSFQASLNNLQTTYLDCLVLHSPLASQQLTLEAWQAMADIFHSGAVKQLGISNCYNLHDLEVLYQKAEVKPAVIQNRFHANTGYDRNIRSFCKQHGIIYQSFWTLTTNPHILGHDSMQSLAKKYRRSVAQVFFRYLSQIGIVPLIGTTSSGHMRDDLTIFEFELSTDECSTIGTLL